MIFIEKNMKIDKFYICHYDKLVDRRKFMESQFIREKLDVEWITNYTKEELYNTDILKDYPKYFPAKETNKGLVDGAISLAFKHIHIINDIIKNNYENVIIFEDDAILEDDFIRKLAYRITELPEDYDFLWIGQCCGLHASNINADKYVYETTSSRCTHCYMISLNCAKKMIDDLRNIDDAIDWWYNKMIIKYNLKNYWLEPSLSLQNKNFPTTLK